MDEKTVARFWAKVDKVNGPVHPLHGQCWVWTAHVNRGGYGRIRSGGMDYTAHRFSWIIAVGDIPAGRLICHHCDNPPCVNPAHLFVGTVKDNADDMTRKGRNHVSWIPLPGASNPAAKLTEAQVIEIRTAPGRYADIGAAFGVSKSLVGAIKTGVVWKHLGHAAITTRQPL